MTLKNILVIALEIWIVSTIFSLRSYVFLKKMGLSPFTHFNLEQSHFLI